MNTWLLAHAGPTRLLVVAVLLALLLAWQRLRPRRGDAAIPKRQWRNIVLVVIASAVVYLLVPVTTVAFAATIAAAGSGVFNMIVLPTAVELLLGIVLLDLAIYWQHRWFHLLPWLWRVHRVHHSIHRDETDSNYGNLLSVWDRLFASCVAQPREGHVGMHIGLTEFRAPDDQTIVSLLRQPLASESTVPFNR